LKIKNSFVCLKDSESSDNLVIYSHLLQNNLKERLVLKLLNNFEEILNRMDSFIKNLIVDVQKIKCFLSNEEIQYYLKLIFENRLTAPTIQEEKILIELFRIDEDYRVLDNM
jgi:hypothetical protein